MTEILMSDFEEFQPKAIALLKPTEAPASVIVLITMSDGGSRNQIWAQSGSAALELAGQLEYHAAQIRKAAVGLGDARKKGRGH